MKLIRKNRKYLFADFLLLVASSVYLRIRTIDFSFFDSLQPSFLWMITVFILIIFSKIGRIIGLIISIIINFLCLFLMEYSNNKIIISSILHITNQCILVFIISICLYNWRSISVRAFYIVTGIGNLVEIINVFTNAKWFKYIAFLIILIVGTLRLQCKQQNNRCSIMNILNQQFILKNIYYFIMGQLVLANIIKLFDMLNSRLHSWTLLIPLYVIIIIQQYSINNVQESFYLIVLTSLILYYNQFILLYFYPVLVWISSFSILSYFQSNMQLPNQNTDYIAIMAFIQYHFGLYIYNLDIQFQIFLILGIIIAGYTFYQKKQWIKIKTIEEQNYEQFESVRNDETVL